MKYILKCAILILLIFFSKYSSEMKKIEDQKAVEQKKTRRRKDVPVKNCFLNRISLLYFFPNQSSRYCSFSIANVDQTITVFSKRGFDDFLRSDCMKHIQQDKKARAKKIKSYASSDLSFITSSRKSINSILSSETDFIHDVTDVWLIYCKLSLDGSIPRNGKETQSKVSLSFVLFFWSFSKVWPLSVLPKPGCIGWFYLFTVWINS